MRTDSIVGYDLVYAITDKSINTQFQLLFDEGVISPRLQVAFNATSDGEPNYQTPTSISAELAAPFVRLREDTAETSRIQFHLPFQSGTFRYWSIDPVNGDKEAMCTPVDGWTLVLDVNLAKVPYDVSMNSSMSDSLKNRLAEVDTNIFSIQTLFIQLDNVEYILSASTFTGKAMENPAVVDQFKTAIGLYLKQAKERAYNPYFLGFTPCATSATSVATPYLVPTGRTYTQFSTTGQSPHTLNYCLMTAGAAKPTDPGAGIFATSPVADVSDQGAFYIANYKMMDQLARDFGKGFGFDPSHFVTIGNERHMSIGWNHGTLTIIMRPMVGSASIDAACTFDRKDTKDFGFLGDSWASLTATWVDRLTFNVGQGNSISVDSTRLHWHVSTDSGSGGLGKIADWIAEAISTLSKFASDVLGELSIDIPSLDLDLNPTLSFDANNQAGATKSLPILLPTGTELMFSKTHFDQAGHLVLATTVAN